MKYFFMGISVIVLVWAGTFALMISEEHAVKTGAVGSCFYVMKIRAVQRHSLMREARRRGTYS